MAIRGGLSSTRLLQLPPAEVPTWRTPITGEGVCTLSSQRTRFASVFAATSCASVT